jgi:GNAT superfamily N-acetyltransferase
MEDEFKQAWLINAKEISKMNIKFIHITDLNNQHTEQAFVIYRESFPANERQKEEVVRQRLNLGTEELFVGLKDDAVISMGLVFNLSNSKFVLLDYFAVSEHERGSGTGTLFMQFLIQCYNQSNKQMIMEVEDPHDGKNLEERQRRVNFYRRLGAKCLQDVHYILPAMDGTTSTTMILMIFAQGNFSALPRSEVERLLLDLYQQVYNKNADDPLVLDVINRLPKIIKLQ